MTNSISKIELLLGRGRLFDAYNCSIESLKENPESVRLGQLAGLCLARLGATRKALARLQSLYDAGNRDAETTGILARVHKDLWRKTGDMSHARLSCEIYSEGYSRLNEYYLGINAATMSLVNGLHDKAREFSLSVLRQIDPLSENYWSAATRAEAFLVQQDYENAAIAYRNAWQHAGFNSGNMSSTYLQLRMIARFLPVPDSVFEAFPPLRVLAFTGHMIDRPGASRVRFPESCEKAVREKIGEFIDRQGLCAGYSSAACGADLIFIEAMQARGMEINVYLPFAKEDFIGTSVSFAGQRWVDRFNKALEKALVHQITEESYLGADELFAFTNSVIMGMSIQRARQWEDSPSLLAVHHGGHAGGGAGDFIRNWPYGDRVEVIDTAEFLPAKVLSGQRRDEAGVKAGPAAGTSPGIQRVIRCVMFADIVGFSKLSEEQNPQYMYGFLRKIANAFEAAGLEPEVVNTWGDAIFAVMPDAPSLMDLALLVRDTIARMDLAAENLPPNMSVRIALHAGPVFIGEDPVTGNANAYGAHINRAARIEPVTLPGCIYASEQFVALLISVSGNAYAYEYVGEIDLPKNFGRQTLYLVSRKDESF